MSTTLLELALSARVPFISVRSDDPVHTKLVLEYVANCTVKGMPTTGPTDTSLAEKSVYLCVDEKQTPAMWAHCKLVGTTVVFVNTKKSVLHLDCGSLFPPKAMLLSWLMSDQGLKVGEAMEAAPALGGLTLKEVYEVLQMAREKYENVSPTALNGVRRQLISKAKGITQIETGKDFYQAPKFLETWVKKNKELFLEPPDPSLCPRGLLFDGPPGTGKTAGAKYIAQEFGLPLYRLDIAAMKGKYVGDSEGSLNAALTQVDQASPCVVLFDEIEKAFNDSSDKGVTGSMLGGLLWWLQEHESQVFVVMTTNKKGILPAELFREQRVDATMVFMGIESQMEASQFAHTVHLKLAVKVGLPPEATIKPVLAQLAVEFQQGQPVPQAKIVQMVHELVKNQLIEGA